jgi:hypothetical protein
MERPCSIEIGSDTTYLIPPPPPPMDAQLGRIPVVHANATIVNHLDVRCIMLMTSSIPPGQWTAAAASDAGDGSDATQDPCKANKVLAAIIPPARV